MPAVEWETATKSCRNDSGGEDGGADAAGQRFDEPNDLDGVVDFFTRHGPCRTGHDGEAQQEHHRDRNECIAFLYAHIADCPSLVANENRTDDENDGTHCRADHARNDHESIAVLGNRWLQAFENRFGRWNYGEHRGDERNAHEEYEDAENLFEKRLPSLPTEITEQCSEQQRNSNTVESFAVSGQRARTFDDDLYRHTHQPHARYEFGNQHRQQDEKRDRCSELAAETVKHGAAGNHRVAAERDDEVISEDAGEQQRPSQGHAVFGTC